MKVLILKLLVITLFLSSCSQLIWEGELNKRGRYTGIGRYYELTPKGDTIRMYEGEMKNGKMYGYGTFTTFWSRRLWLMCPLKEKGLWEENELVRLDEMHTAGNLFTYVYDTISFNGNTYYSRQMLDTFTNNGPLEITFYTIEGEELYSWEDFTSHNYSINIFDSKGLTCRWRNKKLFNLYAGGIHLTKRYPESFSFFRPYKKFKKKYPDIPIFSITQRPLDLPKDQALHSSGECESCSNFEHLPQDSSVQETEELIIKGEYNNSLYKAFLQEYTDRDSNAYVLTIIYDSGTIKKYNLDLPSGLTSLNTCTEQYISLSFACGGPCHSRCFVFLNEQRAPEYYDYCHIASYNSSIISYIAHEEFESLKIRNLENGKELEIDISDCADLEFSPCSIKGSTVQGQALYIYYAIAKDKNHQKQVNIRQILTH